MNNKKNKMYILLLVIAIIVPLVLSISYAYFQAKITGTDTYVTGKSTNTFDINLITENDGYINATNMFPIPVGEVQTKASKGEFKVVAGENKHYVSYSLLLTDLMISANLQVADFKWELINTGKGQVISSGTFAGASGTSYSLKNEIIIKPNTTHYYELRIWIEETTSNQISLAGGTFKGKVTMIADMTYNPVLPLATDYIIGLASTSEVTGVYNEPVTDYRYEGLTPNNYVRFNNELWRIIGVFSDNTHNNTNKKLIKIIRNDSIGDLSWNSGDVNNWATSSLKTYLNGDYYNGIESVSRGMIENVTWKLGGRPTGGNTAETYYTAERGTTVYSGRPVTTTGFIGLMYPSDFGYSALANACERTILLNAYNTATCAEQSWLLKPSVNQWTLMTQTSDSNNIWYVRSQGNIASRNASTVYGVNPVLYLNSDIVFTNGDGTINSPYVLGRDPS